MTKQRKLKVSSLMAVILVLLCPIAFGLETQIADTDSQFGGNTTFEDDIIVSGDIDATGKKEKSDSDTTEQVPTTLQNIVNRIVTKKAVDFLPNQKKAQRKKARTFLAALVALIILKEPTKEDDPDEMGAELNLDEAKIDHDDLRIGLLNFLRPLGQGYVDVIDVLKIIKNKNPKSKAYSFYKAFNLTMRKSEKKDIKKFIDEVAANAEKIKEEGKYYPYTEDPERFVRDLNNLERLNLEEALKPMIERVMTEMRAAK